MSSLRRLNEAHYTFLIQAWRFSCSHVRMLKPLFVSDLFLELICGEEELLSWKTLLSRLIKVSAFGPQVSFSSMLCCVAVEKSPKGIHAIDELLVLSEENEETIDWSFSEEEKAVENSIDLQFRLFLFNRSQNFNMAIWSRGKEIACKRPVSTIWLKNTQKEV